MGCKSPVREPRQRVGLHGQQDDASTGPKQLRGRQGRRSVEADRLSYRAAIKVAEKECLCCSIRKDCQEPPDADPQVRWCGSREGQPSRRPDSAVFSD